MGEVNPAAASINWDKLTEFVAGFIKAVAQASPTTWWAGILGAMASIIAAGLILWLRKKAAQAAIDAAQKDTEIGLQDQIDQRIPENQQNNEKDHDNRSKLDDLK